MCRCAHYTTLGEPRCGPRCGCRGLKPKAKRPQDKTPAIRLAATRGLQKLPGAALWTSRFWWDRGLGQDLDN